MSEKQEMKMSNLDVYKNHNIGRVRWPDETFDYEQLIDHLLETVVELNFGNDYRLMQRIENAVIEHQSEIDENGSEETT